MTVQSSPLALRPPQIDIAPAPRPQRTEAVARAVVERVVDLLGVAVSVADSQGVEIARGGPPPDYAGERGRSTVVVPLPLEGEALRILIGPLGRAHATPLRVVQALVELVVGQLTGAQPAHPNDRKNQLIHDLLNGLITDEAMILRQAALLGMDLAQPRSVMLIDAADYMLPAEETEAGCASDELVRQRARAIIRCIVSFFHLPDDTICAYIGAGRVAILKASNTRNLTPWVDRSDPPGITGAGWANLIALRRASEALLRRLRTEIGSTISIGIGRYHPGICGLARSYQDARAALELGSRFHGVNQVHGLDRLGVAAFIGIADERTKVELALHLLSPLDHEPELLNTLICFFAADCCASSAAAKLAIHRNTLSYRFDKIALLTGLDPRRFDDAVQIRLALLLRSFKG